jgi:hypothetical protein
MHIGEVAARTELSLRSLRHWDEVGLLRPSGRTDGGFRLYTEADVEKILLTGVPPTFRTPGHLGSFPERKDVRGREIQEILA